MIKNNIFILGLSLGVIILIEQLYDYFNPKFKISDEEITEIADDYDDL